MRDSSYISMILDDLKVIIQKYICIISNLTTVEPAQQLLRVFYSAVFLQFHEIGIFLLQISIIPQRLDIAYQRFELEVCLIVIKRNDGHSIVKLETITVCRLYKN